MRSTMLRRMTDGEWTVAQAVFVAVRLRRCGKGRDDRK